MTILNFKMFKESFINKNGELDDFELPDTEDEYKELIWSSNDFKKDANYLILTGKIDMLENTFSMLNDSKKKILAELLYNDFEYCLFALAGKNIVEYLISENKDLFEKELIEYVKNYFSGILEVSSTILDRISDEMQVQIFDLLIFNKKKIVMTDVQFISFNTDIQNAIKTEFKDKVEVI